CAAEPKPYSHEGKPDHAAERQHGQHVAMRCGDDLHEHVGRAEHGSRGDSRCGSKDEAKGQGDGEPGKRKEPSAYVAPVPAATLTMKRVRPALARVPGAPRLAGGGRSAA